MSDADHADRAHQHARIGRVLKTTFYALFVLAGVGFSPFGYTRSEVFVTPKVQLWLASLIPLLGLLLLDVRRRSAEPVVHDRGRAKAVPAAVVAAFVAMVVLMGITALHGNREAWFGYPSIPEGALFFVALLAGFGLLWALTRRYAGLERGVRVAVVVVASIASLASVPQVIDWRTDFTVEIEGRDRKRFIEAGLDPASLQGRRIRVRGWVDWRNGPMIQATHPEQIEILDPAEKETPQP